MTTTANTQTAPSKQFVKRATAGSFTRVAKVMSGELHGFGANVERVVLDPYGKACTDGKTIYVPAELHDDPRYNRVMQEAILAHECAHHRYTDFVDWNNLVVEKIKRGQEDSLLHKMTNMLEDARINHLFGQDWPGSKKMMDFTHEVFMAQHQEATTDASPAGQQAMVAMMSECIAGQGHWFSTPKVVDFMNEVRPTLLNAIKQTDTRSVIVQARRLVKMFRAAFSDDPEAGDEDFSGTSDDDLDHSDIKRASEAQQAQGRNPEEAGRERFQDMKQPTPPQPQNSDENGDDDSGDSTATGDESSSEDGDESGAGNNSEGDDADGEDTQSTSGEVGDDSTETSEGGDSGESGDSESGDATESGSESSDGDSNESGDSGDATDGEQTQGGDSGIDGLSGKSTDGHDFEETWSDLLEDAIDALDQDTQSAFDLEHDFNGELSDSTDRVDEVKTKSVCGDHDISVIAGVKEFQNKYEDLNKYADHYANVARAGRGAIRAISKEITRRLKGSDPRYESGFKSGRLNTKQVYKFSNSGFDASRAYMKKANPVDLKASAIVLIDASGSMGRGEGSPAAHAANAAVVYSEVFQALGIDYEIIDFCTGYDSGSSLRVRKAFGSNPTRMERACVAMPSSGGRNADGHVVNWALERLNSRDGNRLLVVISDGAPSGHSPEGMTSSEHLLHVTTNADKICSGVGLIGIGIAGQDTSPFYPNAVKVTNLSTMAQETLPTLRRVIKKMIPKRG